MTKVLSSSALFARHDSFASTRRVVNKNVGTIVSVSRRKGVTPSSGSSAASEGGTSASSSSSSATSPVTLLRDTRTPLALASAYGGYKGSARIPFSAKLKKDVQSESSARLPASKISANEDMRSLSRDQRAQASLSLGESDQGSGIVSKLPSESAKEITTHLVMGFVGVGPLAAVVEVAEKVSLVVAASNTLKTEPNKKAPNHKPNHKAILESAYAPPSRNSASTRSWTTVESR